MLIEQIVVLYTWKKEKTQHLLISLLLETTKYKLKLGPEVDTPEQDCISVGSLPSSESSELILINRRSASD